MQDKIIVAIAAYLEKETGFSEDYRKVTFAKRLPAKMGKDEFCKNRATEIAAAIAPLVEADGSPTKFEKDSLPLDVKLLFHKGVGLYQCIQNYELGILTKDEFIGDMRKVEADLK